MSRHTYNRAFVLAIVLFACLFVPSTYAQIAGATLSGTVADPTGSVIPNAQLSIRNTATGVATTVSSNTQGFYSAPNLQPGDYEIRTSAGGFATSETHVTLAVGAQQLV